ncbi:MAG: hypothetical protein AAGF11_35095 [Myxococcota bacterium]
MARVSPRPAPNHLAWHLLAFFVVIVGSLWSLAEGWKRIADPHVGPTRTWVDVVMFSEPGFAERCGSEESVVVTVVHDPQKEEWIKEGSEDYMHACPNTQVRMIMRPDLRAINEIESGQLKPTLWAPSDQLFASNLEEHWQLAHPDTPLEYGPSLLYSPLVVVLWTDRVEALEQLGLHVSQQDTLFADLLCAGVERVSPSMGSPRSNVPIQWADWWRAAFTPPRQRPASPSLDELREWGRVEVEHMLPTRTSIGATTLILMAHDYLWSLAPYSIETPSEFDDALHALEEQIEGWLRRCEAGQEDFRGRPRVLAQHLLLLGGTRFDGVVITENFALEMLATLDSTTTGPARARVLYPRSTLINSHPTVFFPGKSTEIEAAERFVQYLMRRSSQDRAISFGFRPGDQTLSIRDARTKNNPFLGLRRYGVAMDLGVDVDIEQPPRPGRTSLRTLIESWSNATGRY